MKAYALTDIGTMRKINQDALFASTEPVGAAPQPVYRGGRNGRP